MKAIVYRSNTGHTKKYAEMLAQKTGLPVYELNEAKKALGVFVGSLRKNSYSRQVAGTLQILAPESLDLQIIDLGKLEMYNQDAVGWPIPGPHRICQPLSAAGLL